MLVFLLYEVAHPGELEALLINRKSSEIFLTRNANLGVVCFKLYTTYPSSFHFGPIGGSSIWRLV